MRAVLKFAMIMMAACMVALPVASLATDHPTSNPYETRPAADGYLNYQIIPTPEGLKVEKDVMVTMPNGIKLACNVFRPGKPGKFPVVLSMTPYGKDQTPPTFINGVPSESAWAPFIQRVHAQGEDVGHMKISLLTSWEAPDPAFWVPNDYVVVIVDQRGGFKSEGKPPTGAEMGDDLYTLIEWAASQEWSNGNVGMIGVSALARNQYWAAAHDPAPSHLKAIIPWEGNSDTYRDASFWGGIPETNFTLSVGPFKSMVEKSSPEQAAKIWATAMDPVANQKMLRLVPRLDRITIPALVCASWSDKGLHTPGTFEVYRRIASQEKWLYNHGGKKWERFYSPDGNANQKKFFDHYLKGVDNGWQNTPRVRIEVRETRDEYTVRAENEFPLARTQYRKLYLNAQEGSLDPQPAKPGKVAYNSTQGGNASFGITFDEDTELTGYMKLKLWVSAESADDMDLFVMVKKFGGPCDVDTVLCKTLEEVVGKGRVAKGNEIQFRGMNGYANDMVSRGQMRVSQREPDEKLSTPWQPMQKFQGEKKLQPGEIVPIEIALVPSSTLFRKGESLTVFIQGYALTGHPLMYYDWLLNKGKHVIYTGSDHDSYLQIPVIPN
jgi:predicted acyl esterase